MTVETEIEKPDWVKAKGINDPLIWVGRPVGVLRASRLNLPVTLSSLALLGITLFLLSLLPWDTIPPVNYRHPLWQHIAVFGIIGAYISGLLFGVVGYWLLDAFILSRTYYAMTDKAVYIYVALPWIDMRRFTIRSGMAVDFRDGPEATLFFGTKVVLRLSKNSRKALEWVDVPVGFELIERGADVYALFKERMDVWVKNNPQRWSARG